LKKASDWHKQRNQFVHSRWAIPDGKSGVTKIKFRGIGDTTEEVTPNDFAQNRGGMPLPTVFHQSLSGSNRASPPSWHKGTKQAAIVARSIRRQRSVKASAFSPYCPACQISSRFQLSRPVASGTVVRSPPR